VRRVKYRRSITIVHSIVADHEFAWRHMHHNGGPSGNAMTSVTSKPCRW
jgi:hypothetical protein